MFAGVFIAFDGCTRTDAESCMLMVRDAPGGPPRPPYIGQRTKVTSWLGSNLNGLFTTKSNLSPRSSWRLGQHDMGQTMHS